MASRDRLAANRVRDFLESSIGEAITLDDVARIAGVSRFHVIRLFRQAYGLTPFAYRRMVRLRRARELLREGLRAVDVAYEVGFSDQSHLCNALRSEGGAPTAGDSEPRSA